MRGITKGNSREGIPSRTSPFRIEANARGRAIASLICDWRMLRLVAFVSGEVKTSVSQLETTNVVRAMGRWSLAALMINIMAGSGIFGRPRWHHSQDDRARLLSASPLAESLSLPPASLKLPRASEKVGSPMGPLFALLGIAFCAVVLSRAGRVEAVVLAVTLTIALLNWIRLRHRSGEGAPDSMLPDSA